MSTTVTSSSVTSSSRPTALVGGFPLAGFSSEEALEFLNEELSLLGISSLDPTVLPKDGGDDAARILRTIFQMVELQRRNVAAIDGLEAEKRASVGERDRLGRQLEQLQQQHSTLKRSAVDAKEKERRADVKVKELAKMLHVEKEEKKKLFQAMQYKEKQFVHESRKSEREMARLKEHLQQLDKGETILVQPKINTINDLKRPGGRRRSTWSNLSSTLTKEEEALYSVVVANYGERQKQLLAENASLRQSLASLRRKVDDALGLDHDDDGNDAEIERSRSRLPLRFMSTSDVEEKLDRVLDASSEGNPKKSDDSHLDTADNRKTIDSREIIERSNVVDDEERKRLLAKVDYYAETIERQAKMIERLAVGNSLSNSTLDSFIAADSSFASAASRADDAELSFADIRRERDALMRQKKEVADEALNLAKERLVLREERYRLVTSTTSSLSVNPAIGVHSVQIQATSQSSSKPALGSTGSDRLPSQYLTDPSSATKGALSDTRKADGDTGTSEMANTSSPANADIAGSPVLPLVTALPSSGRSTTMTSFTSLSRLDSSLNATATDDVGAYI